VVQDDRVLECVVNVSEGRRADALERLTSAAGQDLLDLHHDPHHHRAVLTLVGEDAARAVASEAIGLLDLRIHEGVHPRLGVVDVVPFVPLAGATLADAVAARDAFAAWAATELEVPCFLYGPGAGDPTLPELRRDAWSSRRPDHGPSRPHPTGGAICVGARAVLVAYNVWLAGGDVAQARRVAAAVRRPAIRVLGLAVGDRAQVSMNLIAPEELGPEVAYDLVRDEARAQGGDVEGAELVGLVPEAVLHAVPGTRWSELGLAADRTIEARLAQRAARRVRP
jgi:glutamate formiminotransferase